MINTKKVGFTYRDGSRNDGHQGWLVLAELRNQFGTLINRVAVSGPSLSEIIILSYKAQDRGEERILCEAIRRRCIEDILQR